jgi:ATP-dependent DNA helicase DinG
VVVNLHLYGTHLASGGVVLPEHEVVVLDEAHQLEDVISDAAGLALSGGRFANLARLVRAILADESLVAGVAVAGTVLADALTPWLGRRLTAPLPEVVTDALVAARARIDTALEALRSVQTDVVDANQRKIRAQKASTTLAGDIDAALALRDGYVAWVGGTDRAPRLEVAPLDVGPTLHEGVWSTKVAVLTSATVPAGLPARVGLTVGTFDQIDVGSPFDYQTNGLLYCAAHLPDPRRPGFDAAVHDELAALIRAAGGRTLALFTSWRALDAAVEALRPRVDVRILTQEELPKPKLVAAFRADETSCLFATAGLFQGIDVPGAALSLVTIDRLPFPRPDEPLLQARRERVGPDAFRVVDLPRAGTLLAQAAGRLVRTATDRGVVAVFDPRLASAAYRWDLVRALPPMRRTRHRAEAEAMLAEIAAARATGGGPG